MHAGGTRAMDSSSGEETEPELPLTKTRKLEGAAKYPTRFNREWSRKWPCIQEASNYKFRCTLCQCLVSCKHQGEKDVRRHIEGKRHRENASGLQKQQSIGAFFRPDSHPLRMKVTRAEVKVSALLAHHNVPIAVTDHLSPLFKDIFPDSEIAKAYSCARTKTTCILNGALAKHFRMDLVEHMKNEPFSLATDGSNDSGLKKMNPLTVRIFDVNQGRVVSQILDMCLTSSSTAEAIFTKINSTLENFDISWNRCVSFGVDNTNVNIGQRNSIKTRVHHYNPSVYFVGCPCHMVHNTASKASDSFEVETGFDIEDMLVDLYYWFDKSTKRKNELLHFCEFCDMEYRTIVKHVSVRWLSLECAVERTLKQYSALKSYFVSSEERQPRFLRLKALFSTPTTEVYLLFFQAVLPLFTKLNKFLQRESPCIHALDDVLKAFLKNVLGKFVKITCLRDLHDGGVDVDFSSRENQLDDLNIFVGFTTKQLVQKLLHDGDIAESDSKRFYRGVRAFYMTTAGYIISTYPLKDDVLKHARLIDFEKRQTCTFESVEFFVNLFPHLESLRAPREMEQLQEEFVSYQLLCDSQIPGTVWEEASSRQDDERYCQIDVLWGYICKMQCCDSSNVRFPRLLQVAKSVLVIPHSNASEERIFSMVRKNKTPFRPNLGIDKTLLSLLTVKLGVDEPCEKFEPSKELLESAKKATTEYNRAHSSK